MSSLWINETSKDGAVHSLTALKAFPESLPASRVVRNGTGLSISFPGCSPHVVEFEHHVTLTIETAGRFALRRSSWGRYFSDVSVPGRSFLDGPGERVTIAAVGDVHILQFRLHVAWLERIMKEDHGSAGSLGDLKVLHGEQRVALARLAGQAILSPSERQDLIIRAMVSELMTIVNTTPCRIAPARLRRVCDMVEAELADVTVAKMAAEAALSPFHFTRAFRSDMGVGPWAYVLHCRIWRAALLLAARHRSVAEVARTVGFCDASHLRKAFRDYVHAVPSAARSVLVTAAPAAL